ncbi:transposase [Xenorhabdus khoisanae]|uniref:Transposase n=1 Tax=Xenorhabdus khoisanae TaxID=880157 RepID=A0A0J5FMC7_9GAMM|nr:transposase [Xenorhabdus khoisanae]
MNEPWSHVKSKNQARRPFYAYDQLRRNMIAHVFGPMTKKTLMHLMVLLSPFNMVIYMLSGWKGYEKMLTEKLHMVSRRDTQRIERYNLNLRRKTLSFSKFIEMHVRVIRYYLNICHYQ